MGSKVGALFLLVIALGVGLYVYNSGFVGKGLTSLEALAPHPSSSTAPSNPYVPPQGSGGAGGGAVIAPTPTSSINPYEIPAGFTVDQLSPYFHQVRFGGMYAGSYYSPGQITLYSYPAGGVTSIDVTGWQIKANRGGEYIPQAVNVYDPLGLSAATDIRLAAGDYLYIYSTSAPVNLRLNKCIGYLPNKAQFNPQLPQTCPYVDRSGIQSFTGACQNYVMSLGSCQLPDLSDPRIPTNDYNCRQYLSNNFSYKACFDAHQGDTDFLSREVRVWMGANPIDPSHDAVQLLDRKGLLVDLYTY